MITQLSQQELWSIANGKSDRYKKLERRVVKAWPNGNRSESVLFEDLNDHRIYYFMMVVNDNEVVVDPFARFGHKVTEVVRVLVVKPEYVRPSALENYEPFYGEFDDETGHTVMPELYKRNDERTIESVRECKDRRR